MKHFLFFLMAIAILCSCDRTEEITYVCSGHNDTIYVFERDTVYINNRDSIFVQNTDSVIINNTDQYYYRYKIIQDAKYFIDTIAVNDPDIYNLQYLYPNHIEIYNSSTGKYETTGLWRYEWYTLKSLRFNNAFNEEIVENEYGFADNNYGARMLYGEPPVFGPVSKGFEAHICLTALHEYGYYTSSNYGSYYPYGTIDEKAIPEKMFLIRMEVSKNHEPFVTVKEAYGKIEYIIPY